jgi:hypothetical protein
MAAECAGVSPSVDEVKSCVAGWFEREITRLLAT